MKNYKILRLEGNRIQQLIGYEYDKKNQLINEWVAGVTAVSRLFGKKALDFWGKDLGGLRNCLDNGRSILGNSFARNTKLSQKCLERKIKRVVIAGFT